VLGFLSRLVARALLWVRILRTFRGFNLASELNLWLSALADTLLYTVAGWRANPRLLLRGLYTYKVEGLGLAIVRGSTDDFYYLLPRREGDVEGFVVGRLGEGSVFVDVGANVGYYTLLASKLVGSRGLVYAVEPIPSTAAMLRANVKLNGCPNVIVVEKAAWSSRGRLSLRVPGALYGLVSMFREGKEVVVEAVPLDEVLNGADRIDVVKIDVEGAELEALLGSWEVLKRARALALELSRNAGAVLELLRGAGFKCKKARFTTYVLCERR
jgi:FkbM family methyltransferase